MDIENDVEAGGGTQGTSLLGGGAQDTSAGVTDGDTGAVTKVDNAGASDAKSSVQDAKATYELTAPEGFPMEADALKAFAARCMSSGMSKEQADSQLAWMREHYQAAHSAQERAMTEQRAGWVQAIKTDAEYGGAKFDATLADARRALKQFDDGGTLAGLLESTGYGDNPDVVKILARVGRMLGEDRTGAGKASGAGEQGKSLAEKLYPEMFNGGKGE